MSTRSKAGGDLEIPRWCLWKWSQKLWVILIMMTFQIHHRVQLIILTVHFNLRFHMALVPSTTSPMTNLTGTIALVQNIIITSKRVIWENAFNPFNTCWHGSGDAILFWPKAPNLIGAWHAQGKINAAKGHEFPSSKAKIKYFWRKNIKSTSQTAL